VILLYGEKFTDVDLPQVIPTCESFDARVIPLVGEDLQCLHSALRKASRGVVLRTRSRLWISLARELRADLTIYVWGLPLRRRSVIPIYPAAEYRGPGVYYVKNRHDLRALVGKAVDGFLLDARGFDPRAVELAVKGELRCDCVRCDVAERLLCNWYREVEVL
jgi:hypothetical protein